MTLNTTPKRQRNQRIIALYNSDPELSMAEVGRLFNISRQRVSKILKQYKIVRECPNCYHYQDSYCACREFSDMVKTPNKCPDWIERK